MYASIPTDLPTYIHVFNPSFMRFYMTSLRHSLLLFLLSILSQTLTPFFITIFSRIQSRLYRSTFVHSFLPFLRPNYRPPSPHTHRYVLLHPYLTDYWHSLRHVYSPSDAHSLPLMYPPFLSTIHLTNFCCSVLLTCQTKDAATHLTPHL